MSDLIQFISVGSEAWLPRLWQASWQGAIAIALAWGIARWCTFLSPRVICWIWRLVCLKVVIALIWLTPVSVPIMPPIEVPAITSAQAQPVPILGEAQITAPTDADNVETRTSVTQPTLSIPGWLAFGWSVGVLLSMTYTTRQWARARQLRSSTKPAGSIRLGEMLRDEANRLDVRRLPMLCVSCGIESPLLVGILHSAIILPARIEQMFHDDELRLMLAHELAHLKRRDLAWNWLPTVIGWLFFFHPLVWLLHRRWMEAQEAACDELVLQRHQSQTARYGQLLLKLATQAPCERRMSPAAAGVLGAYCDLERRFLAIAQVRPRSVVQSAVAGAVLAIVSFPGLIPWRLVAREALAEKPATSARRDDTSQPSNSADKTGEAPITGTAITSTFRLDEQPAGKPTPQSDAHVKAAAEIEKLGGVVSPFVPRGTAVVLTKRWKGGNADIDRLFELDDLRTVVIEDCTAFPLEDVAALTRLKALDTLQLSQPSDEHVHELREAENIRNLSLFGNLFTDASLVTAATLPNLTSILLAGRSAVGEGPDSRITDAGLVPLARCKKLQRLSVNDCPQVTGRTMGEFDGLHDLQDVWLIQLPVSDEGLAAIARLSNVKRLHLSTQRVTSARYAPLAKMTRLDQLALYDAVRFDDQAVENLVNLMRLQVLLIQGAPLTDAGLAHLAPLTNLHGLDIYQGSFSDAGLKHLRGLVEVRRLTLGGTAAITDAGLNNLVNMVHLKQLSVSSKSITDAGLATLAELPNLETLYLSGSGIRGSGMDALAKLPKLRVLDLDNSLVGDDELSRLAKLAALEVLHLNNTNVTDQGMTAIARLPRLTTLQLVGDKITDAGLEALSELKTLRSLRIDSLAVTTEARQRLEKQNQQLRINGSSWTKSAMPEGSEAEFLELANNGMVPP